MEMFIKPMLDSILSNPRKDPLKLFTNSPHDTTIGKEFVTVKEEQQEPNIKCNDCGKICLNEKGLNIHKGKVHTVKPPVKRNRSEYELCQENENQCTNCGYECERKAALEWHQKKCTKRTKTFHNNRILTPANKKAMRNINQDIDSLKPHIDDINATRASKKESS